MIVSEDVTAVDEENCVWNFDIHETAAIVYMRRMKLLDQSDRGEPCHLMLQIVFADNNVMIMIVKFTESTPEETGDAGCDSSMVLLNEAAIKSLSALFLRPPNESADSERGSNERNAGEDAMDC